MGRDEGGRVYYILDPYVGVVHVFGARYGRMGGDLRNCYNIVVTYPCMEMSTYLSS